MTKNYYCIGLDRKISEKYCRDKCNELDGTNCTAHPNGIGPCSVLEHIIDPPVEIEEDFTSD